MLAGALRRSGLVLAALAALLACAGAASGRAADAFTGSTLEVAPTSFAGVTSVGLGVELGTPDSGVAAVAAHVDVSIPAGYTLDLTGRPSATIAQAAAIALPLSGAPSPGLLFGDVSVVDAATYAADPVAQACAPGPHAAYWRETLEPLSTGPNIVIPIAVDTGSTETGATTYTLRFCPLVPTSTDIPSGLALVASFIQFGSVLGVPAAPGTYQWSALVTPASPTLTPDTASTFELRANVPVPQSLTLRARYVAASHTAVLTGRLLAQGQPRAGANVSISRASSPLADVRTTTRADGSFSATVRVTRTEQFDALVGTASGACTSPSTAPGGCRDESLAGASSLTAVLVVPRSTDPKVAPRARDQNVARRSVLAVTDLSGSQVVGDAPPPCEGFAPNIHRLTETGDQRSSLVLSGDRTAEVYTTASVFKTVDDARADVLAIGQSAGTRCEATNIALGSGARLGSLQKLGLPKVGDDVRGFRATVVETGQPTLDVEVMVVRVGRVVLVLHMLSLGPATALDLSLARKLAGRAR